MATWPDDLRALHPCADALTWAEAQPDLATAWAVCERGDWMLWLLGKLSGPVDSASRKRLVGCARDCARTAWPSVSDGETAMAIALCDHIVGEYVAGRADLEDVRAAYAAAYAAADAAADAYAYAAAYAAADAAYAAYAYADAYAYAAAAAAAYADAADAARSRVLRECADIVRQHYPDTPQFAKIEGQS